MSTRNRKSKKSAGASDKFTPTLPSQIPLATPPKSSAPRAPLIDLSEDDLRAAGVTFHDGGDIGGKSASDWVEKLDREGITIQRIDDEDEAYEVDEDGMTAEDRAIEAFWDEFFDALMWTVPFSFLYLMLDILTNLSYSHHPSFGHYLKNYAMSTPTLGIIMFYTTRHNKSLWVRGGLTLTSIVSGSRLIWLVNKASYTKVIAQGPAMGTLWILTIVQLPLTFAVLALAGVAGWMYRAKMKLIP